MLESRFCVLDFASYFSLKYSIGVVLAEARVVRETKSSERPGFEVTVISFAIS